MFLFKIKSYAFIGPSGTGKKAIELNMWQDKGI